MAVITLTNPTEINPSIIGNKTAGAYPNVYEVKFRTSIPSGIPTANFYVKWATWLADPSINLGDNPTDPGSNYFSIYTNNGIMAAAAWYEMKWNGSENNRYGRCYIRFDQEVSPLRLFVSFRFNYLNLMDLNGYPPATLPDGVQKLLLNSINNPNPLDNSVPSVYNENKYLRGSFWVKSLPAANEWSLAYAWRSETLKWYDRETANADKLFCDEHTFRFERGNFEVSTLHCEDNTLLKLRLTGMNAPPPNPTCRVYIVKTSAPNTALYFPDALLANLTDTPAPSGTYTNWGIANTVLIAPSTAPTLVASGVYEATVTIDASQLEEGANYRFIALWTCPPFVNPYAFISDEITCNCCEELNDDTVILIDGLLADYQDVYGNYLIVSPKVRIAGQLTVDSTNYDANHTKPYADALCRLRVRYYSEDSTVIQVYTDNVYIRALDGTWPTLPNDSNNWIDIDANGNIYNMFRVRYEGNIPNLQTINKATNLPLPNPSGNMSWIGKNVFVEYTLFLCTESGAIQKVVYYQIVEVRDYDTEMSFEFYNPNTNDVVKFLCSSDNLLNVRTIRSGSFGEKFVSTIETETYGIANLSENENFVPANDLPQQFNFTLLAAQSSQFGIGDAAITNLRPQNLVIGQKYLYCAITKVDAIPVCGSAQSSGGASLPITTTQEVGLNLGDIVVAYQMYSYQVIWGGDSGGSGVPAVACTAADGLQLIYDAVTVNTPGTCPLQAPEPAIGVAGDGYISTPKTAETPTTADTRIIPTAATGCTQWWYKLLCPGVFSQCERTQRADLSQVRFANYIGGTCNLNYTQILHEEAFQFELGTDTGDVNLFYNIPIQTLTGIDITGGFPLTPPFTPLEQEVRYRISVWYNGVEVAATSRLESGTTYSFIDDSGTLTFNHNGSANYFLVIITLWPINIEPNTTQYPAQRWSFRTQCPGQEVENPTTDNGCNATYLYPIPNSKADSGLQTQCIELPKRQVCKDELAPCDFLYNNNICGGDTEYFQPVCAVNPCSHPVGFAQVIIDVESITFPIDQIVMTADTGTGCKNITTHQINNSPFVYGDFIESIEDFLDFTLFAITSFGASYGEKIGNRLILYFSQEYFQETYGYDICEAELMFCGAKVVDGVVVYTEDEFSINIVQQPLCCSEIDCPPETPTYGCAESDRLYFQFRFPDKANNWGSETEDPEFGWYHDNNESWLLKLELADGCCNIIETPTEKPSWVICSGMSWNETDKIPFQTLHIDPTFMPDQFQIAVTINDPICPRTLYSEPYQKIATPEKCDLNARTVLLEGLFGETDCEGKFYGSSADETLNQFCQYKNQYRVFAFLRKTGKQVTRFDKTSSGKALRTVVDEFYLLKTDFIPEYACDRIANILTANEIIIDGISFQYEGKVEYIHADIDQMVNMRQIELELVRTETCKLDSKCTPAGA